MNISDWRRKIDAVDAALLQLLNVRTEFTIEVGKLKAEGGLSLRVPEREHKILSRMKALNGGPLDREAVTKIYRLILDESRRIQAGHGFGNSGPRVHPGAALGGTRRKKGRS